MVGIHRAGSSVAGVTFHLQETRIATAVPECPEFGRWYRRAYPAVDGGGDVADREGATKDAVPRDRAQSQVAGRSHLFGRSLLYVLLLQSQTIAAVLISPALAYLLGPAEFGRLSSAIALHQMLVVIAIFGLDQSISLHAVEDPSDRNARGLVVIGSAISILLTLGALATSPLWANALGFGGVSSFLVAAVIWTAPAVSVQLILALLLAKDNLRSFAAVTLLVGVIGQLVALGLMVFVTKSLALYAWAGVLAQGLGLVAGLLSVRPDPRRLPARPVVSRAFQVGFPLALVGVSTFVLNAGDRLVIQTLLGPTQVGRYQVAYTVGYAIVLFLLSTNNSWTPRFAAVRDVVQRNRIICEARDRLYILLVPLVLGVTLGAPIALRLLAPATFRPSSLLLVTFLVSLSAFPIAASSASAKALSIQRKTRALSAAVLVASAANIALNVGLVGRFGIAAAAAATAVCFAVQALLQRGVVGITTWPRTPWQVQLRIAAGVAAAFLSTLLPQGLVWNLGRLAVGLACVAWFVAELLRARKMMNW